MTHAPSRPLDLQQLDALTGGAFTAPTSGERAARVRDWLATGPAPEQMQAVFKELSVKDKGAARPLREKLDELRRAKGQEALAAEWASRGRALLDAPRINIADAMAWQRDAARAGAPLSREPLMSLRTALAERVKVVEDLQNQAMVQREAAVLLAQRIELLSTRGWKDAQAAVEALGSDVSHWRAQVDALAADAHWPSVDAKFGPMMEAAGAQLQVVWESFAAAIAATALAASDPAAPLPPVPVWADEVRALRGEPAEATPKPARPRIDPAVREEQRQKAMAAVLPVLEKVEREVGEGHGKASVGAAAALRNAVKEHARHLDAAVEARVHAALGAAGELEGWQRWRADQLREELVAKAEALLRPRPVTPAAPAAGEAAAAEPGTEVPAQGEGPAGEPAAPSTEATGAPSASAPMPAPMPAMGGRKMQDTLRQLREQWKAVDKGSVPNHGLWKRFDDACNEAHKVVEVWLEKLKAESAAHRAQRLALIEEVRAWTQRQAERAEPHDWKAFSRALHQFSNRWREAGHLGEKAFAELQPQWKAAIREAEAPLEAAQKDSLDRRHAMVAEATAIGAAPVLRIDAVKALHHRWQAEAQAVPLERRIEQKLWDAFRKPIDEAFSRKSAERDRAAATLSERDRVVLDAAKALEAANASGDAQRIRSAMAALEAALRGQAQAQAEVDRVTVSGAESTENPQDSSVDQGKSAIDSESPAEGSAPAAPKEVPRRVVAMRGDDRPGMKKAEPGAASRGGRPGDRRDGPRGAGRPGDNKFEPRRDERGSFREAREGRGPDRGPRLGDAAFRAQREAVEHAEAALRRLAAQAHGEALTQLLGAWERRDAAAVPGLQELGRGVSTAVRAAWVKAVGASPSGEAQEALLRLEMAAEVPTPAEQLEARRAFQLRLLTRRNDPAPAQTWGQDVATVLASAFEAGRARRLQNALKPLLRR